MHQINFLNFLLILPLSSDSFHASFLFFLKSKVSLAEKRKEKWIIYRWEKKDGSISQSNQAILFEHDFRESFGIGEFGSRRRGSNFSRKSVQVFAATTTKMDDRFNDIDADLWEEMGRMFPGSISKENDFTGRKGWWEKWRWNFRYPTSFPMNPDEFLRATNLPNGREEVESVVVRLDRCHIF